MARPHVRRALSVEGPARGALLAIVAGYLVVFVALPLGEVVRRSLLGRDGSVVGLDNFVHYFSTPSLANSMVNSLYISTVSMTITVALAFVFAYALTRSAMPLKGWLRTLALLPLFAPSLVHAIAFIYLFGRQGLLTRGFFGALPVRIDIGLYREPTGIILAEIFYLFPHALLILVVALSLADRRLYEAASALGASRWRTFFTVTLPSARFGLVSAAFVCFTLVFTDFGIPKVIGGNYNVLATDIYRQVVGQQNFTMGSTVAVLLLLPTVVGFVADRLVRARQDATFGGGSVALTPTRRPLRDGLLFAYCLLVCAAIVGVLGTALYASLVNVWPYDLSLSLRHYDFSRVAGGGLRVFWNSVVMAGATALVGTVMAFGAAYLVEKGKGWRALATTVAYLATLPVALPGLVLGLGYIFFFNAPANPLGGIYGTMAILVASTVVHFFTVGYFTAASALRRMDAQFESVGASLRVPFWTTIRRVTVPLALPALLEIAVYFFVNAMTTVSAVVFLYSAHTRLASVAILSMDDAGDTAAAAAMSMLIVATCLVARLLALVVTRRLLERTQAWRAT